LLGCWQEVGPAELARSERSVLWFRHAAARLQGFFRLFRAVRELAEHRVLGARGRLRGSSAQPLHGTVRALPRGRGFLQRPERLLRGRDLVVAHDRG